jgi:hypothetical protein
MRRFVVLAPLLVFILFIISPAFSEISYDQIVMYRVTEENIKEIRDDFSQNEKIFADFTFLPEEKETGVEFRWISPLNKKEQSYFELVRSPMPPRKQTVPCWLLLQPSLPDKVIGSRFFGQWYLEVWVNNRRVATRAFKVAN